MYETEVKKTETQKGWGGEGSGVQGGEVGGRGEKEVQWL